MRILSFSETGCVRKNNEDAYLVLSEYGLYAVADGMGGHLAGEVAARTALQELERIAPELAELADAEVESWLMTALTRANTLVFESSSRLPETEGMGTTLTVLIVRGSLAVIAHVGDSRAYIWREERLERLTDDHSLVGELLRLGQISVEEAENHPRRHVLMRAIGAEEKIQVDCRSLEAKAKDVFLLCTDGFSNILTEEEIGQEFLEESSWEEHLENLRQLVLERGAPDNFTALCCIVE
ncbi:Stp1/IreP family PP2C-type Ser/Thr phosphatase [Paradesulfitobacterium ferrireducens]|uniref:Stp1/IreP family PP2C-type Ser/Thr phosphatase n=1 Tax=Paradesulfitobacterium ferrireducens TaxID=2816476 RepID=UPI001A8E1E0A|nr:Stp1/IreP family PP2C-type Ser/Thr phosphatase [Paradesulfitobacterium ferrireducens]